MGMDVLAELLPELQAVNGIPCEELTELRLRAGRPVQLVLRRRESSGRGLFTGEPLTVQRIRRIALRLMDHSYHAREEELKKGFFTMPDGCRVGVCGSWTETEAGGLRLSSISSICIRIARAVKGCGEQIAGRIDDGDCLRSALIFSRPGIGKTTLLRDAARILSDCGWNVAIADERHEIAACRDGVPTLDVGCRTDVADGCPRRRALENLARSMSPELIVTDEIGGREDAEILCDVRRRGIAVLASAHAGCWEELLSGEAAQAILSGAFDFAFGLDGSPGEISAVYRLDRREGGMKWICE